MVEGVGAGVVAGVGAGVVAGVGDGVPFVLPPPHAQQAIFAVIPLLAKSSPKLTQLLS